MKNILSIVLLMLSVGTSSFAQEPMQRSEGPRTPEEWATRQTEMMARRLNLSEDQKTKVHDVNLKTAKQNEKFGGQKDSVNFKAVQQAKDAAYKKILNEDQFKQYEEMKARRGEFRRERHQEQ